MILLREWISSTFHFQSFLPIATFIVSIGIPQSKITYNIGVRAFNELKVTSKFFKLLFLSHHLHEP